MKITFTKDRQPDPLNGNSFYPAGTRADLRFGAELVALGVAVEGWGAPVPPFVPEPVALPIVDPAPAESVDFTIVKGITPEMQNILYSRGILNWEDVLQMGVVKIANLEIDGLGRVRARALFAAAQREAK